MLLAEAGIASAEQDLADIDGAEGLQDDSALMKKLKAGVKADDASRSGAHSPQVELRKVSAFQWYHHFLVCNSFSGRTAHCLSWYRLCSPLWAPSTLCNPNTSISYALALWAGMHTSLRLIIQCARLAGRSCRLFQKIRPALGTLLLVLCCLGIGSIISSWIPIPAPYRHRPSAVVTHVVAPKHKEPREDLVIVFRSVRASLPNSIHCINSTYKCRSKARNLDRFDYLLAEPVSSS